MAYSIKGSTALVTGANRGIGEAIVDALVAAGAAKVYAAARNIKDLAPLTARHGARVVALRLDVTDAAQIAAGVSAAPDVQLLVNNAGVAGHAGGAFTDPRWISAGRQEMEVNFIGTFSVTQAFAPVLARNGGGAVVNIASVASLVSFKNGRPDRANYRRFKIKTVTGQDDFASIAEVVRRREALKRVAAQPKAVKLGNEAELNRELDHLEQTLLDSHVSRQAWEQHELHWQAHLAELRRSVLRGTAKIYAGRVTLAYYLLRKPLAFLRRSVGI